jgi:hypothetical protein
LTAAAFAAFMLIPRQQPRAPIAASAPKPAIVPVGPEAPLRLAMRPAGRTTPHPRPVVARLEGEQRTTQILFTGPDGTRIYWLVGSPDAKELGS